MANKAGANFSCPAELLPFVIPNVKFTGKEIGSGAYGTVLEVEVDGVIYAGKKIHDSLINFGVHNIAKRYPKECRLLSNLRHPNVVQFIGVCFYQNDRLPILVMEYLASDLHDTLAKIGDIPLFVKTSILHDVTRGLVYLHCQNPPIIHRDLTARNVLLNSAMVAKIADFGVSRRIVGGHISFGPIALTRVPGSDVYMPPEAFDENPTYDAKLDMFSFGHLALYTLTQADPVPLHPKNVSSKAANFEIERRRPFLSLLSDQLGKDHPLVSMTTHCLSDKPKVRPTAKEVLQLFNELGKKMAAEGSPMRINIPKMLEELEMNKTRVQVLEAWIQKLEAAGGRTSDEVGSPSSPFSPQATSANGSVEKDSKHKPRAQSAAEESLPFLDSPGTKKKSAFTWSPITSKRSPSNFHWKDLPSSPPCSVVNKQAVVLDGVIYISGKDNLQRDTIFMCNPEKCLKPFWQELPSCPARWFAMAVLNHQLVLVGRQNQVAVWNNQLKKWEHPYPNMPTARRGAAAIGYGTWLVVAGGDTATHKPTAVVEILDSVHKKWYTTSSLPKACYDMTSALLNDRWYLVGGTSIDLGTNNAYCVSLPELILHTVPSPRSAKVWNELPDRVPKKYSSVVSLQGSLFVVAGREGSSLDSQCSKDIYVYNFEVDRWEKIGELGSVVSECTCVALPNGKLAVLGGYNQNTKVSTKARIGSFVNFS